MAIVVLKKMKIGSPKFMAYISKGITKYVLYYSTKVPKSECKKFYDQALSKLGNVWLGIVNKQRALGRKD